MGAEYQLWGVLKETRVDLRKPLLLCQLQRSWHPTPPTPAPPRPLHPHALLLASHSLRSISRGSTTSSLNSKSVILDLVYSGSRYIFFSSAAGFFPLGFALDFLQERKEHQVTYSMANTRIAATG